MDSSKCNSRRCSHRHEHQCKHPKLEVRRMMQELLPRDWIRDRVTSVNLNPLTDELCLVLRQQPLLRRFVREVLDLYMSASQLNLSLEATYQPPRSDRYNLGHQSHDKKNPLPPAQVGSPICECESVGEHAGAASHEDGEKVEPCQSGKISWMNRVGLNSYLCWTS
jgi:hypothetical protein